MPFFSRPGNFSLAFLLPYGTVHYLSGDLKFWPLKKGGGGPGVIAELWRGGLEILKRSMFKMEKLTFCI